MKKIALYLLTISLLFTIAGCNKKTTVQNEQVNEDTQISEETQNTEEMDNTNLEPNDDGLGDIENETAGVDDGDGNFGREGETYIDDNEENSITLNGGVWPNDAPIEEPHFYEASISGVISNANGVVVNYIDVGRADAAELIQLYLDDPSWNMLSHTNDSDWEVYSGQNGNLLITIEWDYGDFSILWENFN